MRKFSVIHKNNFGEIDLDFSPDKLYGFTSIFTLQDCRSISFDFSPDGTPIGISFSDESLIESMDEGVAFDFIEDEQQYIFLFGSQFACKDEAIKPEHLTISITKLLVSLDSKGAICKLVLIKDPVFNSSASLQINAGPLFLINTRGSKEFDSGAWSGGFNVGRDYVALPVGSGPNASVVIIFEQEITKQFNQYNLEVIWTGSFKYSSPITLQTVYGDELYRWEKPGVINILGNMGLDSDVVAILVE